MKATGKDGSTAEGSELHLETTDGKPHVWLIGNPLATVSDKSGTLSGPRIRTRLGSAVMVHLLTGTVPVEEASIRLRNYVELVITHPVRAGRMQPSPLLSA